MSDDLQSTYPVEPDREKGAVAPAILAALILLILAGLHVKLFATFGHQLVGPGVPLCTILMVLGLVLAALGLFLRARRGLLPVAFALLALSRLFRPNGSVILAYSFLYLFPESQFFRALFGLGMFSIWLPLILDCLAFAGMALLSAGLSPKRLPGQHKTLRSCCWIPAVLVLIAAVLLALILRPVNHQDAGAVGRALCAELPMAAALLLTGLWIDSVCRRSAAPAAPAYAPCVAPDAVAQQPPVYAAPQTPPQAPTYAAPQTPAAPPQPEPAPTLSPEAEEKRKAYEELLAAGIFTQEEYDRKCAALWQEES